MKLFGRRRRQAEVEEAFIASVAGAPSQLVEAAIDGRTVEPAPGVLAMRLWIAPESPEHIHGEFFGAGAISHHSRDYAGDRLVVQLERRFKGQGYFDLLARRVHTPLMPGVEGL